MLGDLASCNSNRFHNQSLIFSGKYLIMKDPNKPMIRLYDIPDNTFESDGTEGSDEEQETFAPSYAYNGTKRMP